MAGTPEGADAEGDVTTLTFDREVSFATLLGEPITLRATEVQAALDEGRATEEGGGVSPMRCTLRAEAGWATYGRIVSEGAFNLLPAARRDAGVSFEADRNVELRLVLRPPIAALLSRRGLLDAENVVVALVGGIEAPDEINLTLRHSESWLAYEVVQRVPLPEGMEGELKTGYRTAWADADGMQSMSTTDTTDTTGTTGTTDTMDTMDSAGTAGVEPPADDDARARQPLAVTVERFLQGRDWRHQRLNDQLFKLGIRGRNGSWTALIAVDEAREVCMVYSIYPQNVPEKRRPDVARFLVDTNYQLFVGAFEMDTDDGELRFRTSIDVENDRLSDALLGQLLDTNITLMDGHVEELEAVITGQAVDGAVEGSAERSGGA